MRSVKDNSRETPLAFKRSFKFHLHTIWLFTRNDLKTIVYPETAVGIFSALAGASLTTNSKPDLLEVLSRLPLVLIWNWLNLLTFNLANQRLTNSILEDSFNKPWRPMPSNQLSPDEARRLLLIFLPLNTVMLAFIGGLKESVAMMILTWMYNDLGGADEYYIVRNLINACGYMLHGAGATIVTIGSYELTNGAYIWLAMIGGVIFTTLQMQDLEDMEGDAKRGRKTFPLVHGEQVCRWSVAIFVIAWSIICPTFWNLGVLCYIPSMGIGGLVVVRVLILRSESADRDTFKVWCIWIIMLYILPLSKDYSVFIRFWKVVGW